MEPRKPQKRAATNLPADFIRSVVELFNDQFKAERGQAEFLVLGALYMDEVLLCVSLTEPKALRAATIYVSMDLPKSVAENPEKVTEKLQKMVDVAASWLAQTYQESKGKGLEPVLDAMSEMPNKWQDFAWEGEKLFVKLNRDNQVLEREADRLLRKAGFDPRESLDEDEAEGGDEDDFGSDKPRGPLQ